MEKYRTVKLSRRERQIMDIVYQVATLAALSRTSDPIGIDEPMSISATGLQYR